MPQWTVQITDGDDDRVEAGMLAMEGGALVALSEEGLLVRAWAPHQWRTARLVAGVEAHPAGRGESDAGRADFEDNVLELVSE